MIYKMLFNNMKIEVLNIKNHIKTQKNKFRN